jgi:elongation factor G
MTSPGCRWYVEEEIPADLKDRADELRMEMIEAAVELDEAAMEAYLEGERAQQREDPGAAAQG